MKETHHRGSFTTYENNQVLQYWQYTIFAMIYHSGSDAISAVPISTLNCLATISYCPKKNLLVREHLIEAVAIKSAHGRWIARNNFSHFKLFSFAKSFIISTNIKPRIKKDNHAVQRMNVITFFFVSTVRYTFFVFIQVFLFVSYATEQKKCFQSTEWTFAEKRTEQTWKITGRKRKHLIEMELNVRTLVESKWNNF